MPTTNGTRKILDPKRWEYMSPVPAATGAGHFVVSSRHYRQQQMLVQSNAVAYMYLSQEDGFVQLPSPGLAGTFGAGACGVAGAWSTGTTIGASLTATGGTTQTLTTNVTLARDLRGYSVQILSGPNAGEIKTIAVNTVGANATIAFTAASGSTFDATNTYRLMTPVFFVLGAGTLASASFRKYCFATNTWTTLSQTGLPATVGTDGRLVSTPSWMDEGILSFASDTATGGSGTTVVDAARAWATNQWANAQVRIVSGTGAGQIRTITSNTGTTLTCAAFATAPDATSVYSIEGNDDFLYFMGNNAVTLYRYSISANTWSTLAPAVARGGAPGAGLSGHWIWGVPESDWQAQDTIQNGRYIYSFRGAAGALLDRYDIAANSWSAVTYAPAVETFTTGSKYAYAAGALYIQKEATNRWFRYDFARSQLDGWGTMLLPQGAAVVGDTAFDVTYHDETVDIVYVHVFYNSSVVHVRCMVI